MIIISIVIVVTNDQMNIMILGVCVYIYIRLVVLTILENISQWDGLSHILWKNITCLKSPTTLYIYMFVFNDMNARYFLVIVFNGTSCHPNCSAGRLAR